MAYKRGGFLSEKGNGDAMAYEVLARKWRPQKFDDVVGQDHVVQTLKNAIESKRLAHAYLFVGSRGIGKTSIARIFARALNCKKGPTATPCGTCDSCIEIAKGTNLDVLEIDGASNNGVDQVRDLRETVRYAPTHGPFKITIIDEVHMLSTAAFNALLKTLEEPPAHAKFFFATTEPQKIPATVLSRCQRFDLRRIPTPQIVERLRLMGKAEKVSIDEDALLAIARGAEGGLRDAQSALDQLISFRGNAITEADVLSVFGLVARASLEALADAVLGGDIPGLIRLIGELDDSGKDLQRLVVELMEHFRNLLVVLNVDTPALHGDLTDAQLEVLRRQAGRSDTSRALRIVGVLTEAEDRMKFALSRRTLLETALIRCARAATVVSLEEILIQIQALRAGLGNAPAGVAVAAGIPAGTAGSSGPTLATLRPVVRESAPAALVAGAAPAATQEAYAEELRDLMREWKALKEKVAKQAVQAKAILADARPVAVDAGRVVLAFDAEFPQEMKRFETGRDRLALEYALGAFLKRKVKVDFVLVARDPLAEAAASAPEAAKAAAAPSAGGSGAAGRKGKSPQEWAKDPAVNKALEMFNGTILDVRE